MIELNKSCKRKLKRSYDFNMQVKMKKKGWAHDRKSCWFSESVELVPKRTNQPQENITFKGLLKTRDFGNNQQQIQAISVLTGQTCDCWLKHANLEHNAELLTSSSRTGRGKKCLVRRLLSVTDPDNWDKWRQNTCGWENEGNEGCCDIQEILRVKNKTYSEVYIFRVRWKFRSQNVI